MSQPEQDYVAGPFRPLAETELGKQLWRFLNEESVVARLETATELRKPAVAGIEGALLCRFREKVVGRDRIKQMLGHMVRQVLEGKGYCLEKQNVIINSALFSKGTRYSRPEWHRLHVFRKTGDGGELCFAGTRDESALPPVMNGGSWRFAGSFSSPLHGEIVYGLDIQKVRREVDETGHALRRKEQALPEKPRQV